MRAFVVLAAVAGGATLLAGQQPPVPRLGLDSLLVATSDLISDELAAITAMLAAAYSRSH